MAEPAQSIRSEPMSGHREPIAMVGIGCRFPGGAGSPAAFWRLLCAGVDAIGPMPDERFPRAAFDDAGQAVPGKIATRQGGFLEGLDRFDAPFFGVSPREAAAMDPQQRLLLETAWEALEDAGLPPAGLAGSRTGVYIGMWTNEYEDVMFAAGDDVDLYVTTGGGRYAASGRLSYCLDLQGPSLTVDTACSSSLVAVHLACQSLWAGEAELALAGAVNLILQPAISVGYSRSRMLSPDGRCKFGDARADGYVRSEGCAVVVLKPLARALADGDPIYALVRGTATNNDGHSSGLLVAPSGQGQLAMLRDAYAQSGIAPGAVGYVEAHGTGTPVGDPVELRALGAVLAEGRPAGQPCLVGSVKTNIGHTEAASGMAGLIKAALCLKHGQIPASLHFATPNPAIPWDELPLRVQTALGPWPAGDGPRYAGVNSFGVTGTNAHVVLEAPPAPVAAPAPRATGSQLLAVSARSPQALAALARAYAGRLADDEAPFAELAFSAGMRREHHGHRLAVVAADVAEAAAALAAFVAGDPHPSLAVGQARELGPKVAFVFPGQGAQWPGMARELLATEPAFCAALAGCDEAIRAETGWSPREQLLAGEGALDAIDVIQPTLFAVQVALAAMWQSWGIVPAAVVGHSMGEVAAAHVAGALSLEDAAAIICRRSRLLRRVRGQGAMAVLDLSLAEAAAAIAGYEDRLAVAVSNGPRSTVLSGDPAALAAVVTALEARQVFCRPVKVDVASHSPQMDPLLDELRAALTGLTPRQAAVPIYSTVLGGVVDGSGLDAAYWARNLRQPVLFATAAQALAEHGHSHVIEISPHPILLPAVEQLLRHSGHAGSALPSLRRAEPERVTMLRSLAALYADGAAVCWPAVFPAGGRHVALPAYPWQRERFWYELPAGGAEPRGGHPLLGQATRPATDPGTTCWGPRLDGRSMAFLADHTVRGAAILPATGYVELALAAADQAGGGPFAVERLALREALPIPAGSGPVAQLLVEADGDGALRFRVYAAADHEAAGPWRIHADGRLRPGTLELGAEAPAAAMARCPVETTGEAHYRAMAERGLRYGPAFRTVAQSWRGAGEILGRLTLPATVPDGHGAQIALLDGCLQLAVAALPAETAGTTFLPVRVGRLQRFTLAGRGMELWGHATLTGRDAGGYCFDLALRDGAGRALALIEGLVLERAGSEAAGVDELLYELRWEPAEGPASAAAPPGPGSWLIYGAGRQVDELVGWLAARGERCVVAVPGAAYARTGPDRYSLHPACPDQHGALLREAFGEGQPACRGVVYALGAAIPPLEGAGELARAEELGVAGAVALVQALGEAGWALAPRLWLVTEGAQAVEAGEAPAVAQAPLWGLGRVVASETPALRCTLVDCGSVGEPAAVAALCAELWAGAAGSPETQLALRGTRRFVARLARRAPGADAGRRPAPAGAPFRLVAAAPGALDSLRPREVARPAPGPGSIEVRVEAAGLNFLDVMKALGIYPGLAPSPELALGAECAGTVVRVDSGVTEHMVGDRVVVITPSYEATSCIADSVVVPAAFAAPIPSGLSAAEAAGLPVVFVTAYYALHTLGGLRRGQRVLIHAAAGGVGLAAVQLCQRAGAEIFATAGSPAKREFLRSLGVEHVFDSRSLAFADQVMERTGGRGVDLVLNSLAGPAIPRSLELLAPRGRFLEIGKRDIYADSRIGLEPFKRNLAFFAIDLAALTCEEPAFVAGLFHEVMALVAAGELRPLPTELHAIGAAEAAFRAMAQARHIGKLVLAVDGQPVAVEASGGVPIRADGSYLITGGLGDLGLAVARRLVEGGARHLALLGRGAPGTAAAATIGELEAAGARVITLRADVARRDELAGALGQLRAAMPPLRGVVHAAGLLADATIAKLDRDGLRAALAPKVDGAWHLHTLTAGDPLELFVLFSSAVALLGNAGQANYAAGNAFLDALAHSRKAAGLPALSVNWGPWAAIGLAAAQANRGARLGEQGLGGLAPAEALAALDLLVAEGATQAAVMRLDPQSWAAQSPGGPSPFFAGLLAREEAPAPTAQGLREALLAAEPGRPRRTLLEAAVGAELAQVLRIAAERIDRGRPLKAMGLDSLMALELRNRLETRSGLTLSATLAWNYPTVAIMAEFLAERLGVALERHAEGAGSVAPEPAAADEPLAELSPDELEALLSDELAAVDRLLNAE